MSDLSHFTGNFRKVEIQPSSIGFRFLLSDRPKTPPHTNTQCIKMPQTQEDTRNLISGVQVRLLKPHKSKSEFRRDLRRYVERYKRNIGPRPSGRPQEHSIQNQNSIEFISEILSGMQVGGTNLKV
jgi:hypothetical protein